CSSADRQALAARAADLLENGVEDSRDPLELEQKVDKAVEALVQVQNIPTRVVNRDDREGRRLPGKVEEHRAQTKNRRTDDERDKPVRFERRERVGAVFRRRDPVLGVEAEEAEHVAERLGPGFVLVENKNRARAVGGN